MNGVLMFGNRREFGSPVLPQSGFRPTKNGHNFTSTAESHGYYDQDMETSHPLTGDPLANQLSQGHLTHEAIGDSTRFEANPTRSRDLNLINVAQMGEPWLISRSPIGSTWPAAGEGRTSRGWESNCATSPDRQTFYPSNYNSTFNPLIYSEPTASPLSNSLDPHDGVVQLSTVNHSFGTSTLSHRTEFESQSRLSSDCEIVEVADDATMSCGSNEATLRPTSDPHMTSAQSSLFQALLSLGEPLANDNPAISSSPHDPGSASNRSQSQSMDPVVGQDPGCINGNDDPECIESILCGQLVLDHKLESNSLPFALHSYAVWMRRNLFDPSRAAARTRDYVIRHFAESNESRFRTILIANIFRSIATNPIIDLSYLPKISALKMIIHKTLADSAKRKLNPSREIQIRESIRALEQTIELFAAVRYEPLHICLQLMREAAPVFRRACPEPMNQLVHLPGILIHPNANMRHYPVMDVYFSIITGLPTNLKYDTSLRTPIDSSVLYIDNHLGLSWLYGQPDRITLILARTNSLYQDFGTSVDARIIREIEQDIRSFKANYGNSPDPSLLVIRLIVQECWRQVAYIYLYMTLCNANTLDTRVRIAQQRLMKLINDTKPTPALDMYLAPCLGIVGVATREPTEREAMLLRLRGLPECSRPESCFSSCIQILKELWRQTDSEDRPAMWSDFRGATLRVLGVQWGSVLRNPSGT
ncbi:unnamed protein product [Rhizoctonia solani]|uniref:Fungal-specific transcription factor domain protein n=1 Tax=Rhizoctonia solani TaxID=456999 RepID=A0A8H3BWM3_9AGAM|nr:unnamed protein product [Rhizoctonia solani]